jgi:hypothetical protein
VILGSPLLNLLNVRYVVSSSIDGVDRDLRPVDPQVPADQYRRVFSDFAKVFENRASLPRVLLVPNVRVVTDRQQIIHLLASGEVDPRHTLLVEDDWEGAPGAATAGAGAPEQLVAMGAAQYRSIGVNRVRIDVTGTPGGMLLVLDPFWPGWVARVDGVPTEIHRANFLFRAVAVPPGDHVVTMTYEPLTVRAGLALTAPAVVVVLLVLLNPRLLAMPLRQKRH